MRLLKAWLLAILVLAGSPALAAIPPRPDGPVLDQAEIIPPAEEAALDAKLREYNKRTGRALVVATVSSLDGEDIETYGTTLAHSWGVGGKETDQGLVLLVAPNERKMRIEVGYGLEAYLPDVLAGRIVRDTIRPRFKAGDMVGGINAGIEAVTTQLDRDPAEAKAIAEAAAVAAAAEAAQGRNGGDVSIVSVIFWLGLMFFFMTMFGRRRRGFRRSGIDPGIVLWGISEIAHHASRRSGGGGFGGGIDFGGGGGGGFGGFGGGGFGGGGASGDW
jgi:uncharacterized protein